MRPLSDTNISANAFALIKPLHICHYVQSTWNQKNSSQEIERCEYI